MAGKKINDLTPLGRNLISTDELELSLAGAAGSRKVTGAELTAGLQPTLVSGTNIKTINSTTVLGSGNLVVGSGLKGVHAILPLTSGNSISAVVNGTASANLSTFANRIIPVPFISNQTFVSASLSINLVSANVGQNARILIYSDLNGRPNTKLYESANLDCGTIGVKTALVSFTFTEGQTYWIGTHFSVVLTVTGHNQASLLSIGNTGIINANNYYLNVAFGSAPVTYGVGVIAQSNVPAVFIIVA
jgi:hypothetical protein